MVVGDVMKACLVRFSWSESGSVGKITENIIRFIDSILMGGIGGEEWRIAYVNKIKFAIKISPFKVQYSDIDYSGLIVQGDPAVSCPAT